MAIIEHNQPSNVIRMNYEWIGIWKGLFEHHWKTGNFITIFCTQVYNFYEQFYHKSNDKKKWKHIQLN